MREIEKREIKTRKSMHVFRLIFTDMISMNDTYTTP
jgi:hypothetical protein